MSTQPTTFNAGDQVKGIDVSHNNNAIDWKTIAATGITFAFTKASEGASFRDPQFNANYAAIKSNGMIRGSYHFFHPNTDAGAQAANFLKLVQALGPGDLPPVLDIEVNDNCNSAVIIKGVQLWLDTVGAALHCQPIIYTSASFWNGNLGGTDQFADHRLWVAHYTTSPQPNIPTGFPDYSIWQFTEQGQISGIGGKVDLNRFNGTLDDLRELAGF
jgi:lysozyme